MTHHTTTKVLLKYKDGRNLVVEATGINVSNSNSIVFRDSNQRNFIPRIATHKAFSERGVTIILDECDILQFEWTLHTP